MANWGWRVGVVKRSDTLVIESKTLRATLYAVVVGCDRLAASTYGTKGCQHVRAVAHCNLLFKWSAVEAICTRTANHCAPLLGYRALPVGNTGAGAIRVIL